MNGDSALHWAAYKGYPGLMQVHTLGGITELVRPCFSKI